MVMNPILCVQNARENIMINSKNEEILSVRINKTILPEFLHICTKTQRELKKYVIKKLRKSGYDEIYSDDGYVYAKGEIPILLTAHLDTVHKSPVIEYIEIKTGSGKHIISSPQGIGGDDRCGIYIILQIIKNYKCYVLFCEDEEMGGIGSSKFCCTSLLKSLDKLNCLIELDRANHNDAVFYECDNKDFTSFILGNIDYYEDYGSFSDISIIAPACGIAAVNLSCGYYKAHTLNEYVVIEEMLATAEAVKKIIVLNSKQYKYIESKKYYSKGILSDFYPSYYTKKSVYIITYYDHENECYEEEYVLGYSKNDALEDFYSMYPDTSFNNVLDIIKL